MLPSFIYTSYGKGFLIALDIFIIIFGAIFFLEILKDLKIIKNISYYLESFSKDYRIQIIVIAWLFEALLEGTAGFGTAGAIAVPLLIGLGLSPMKSLIVGLLANSTPGIFGAAGTPIRVGFAGLSIPSVPIIASLLSMVGVLIPIFILWIITKGRPNHKKEFFEALPFAIWSGVAFILPSILSVSLGQEFPTIIGAVVGLILVVITTKLGIFVPKNSFTLKDEKEITCTMSPFKAFSPYILLIIFLILGKLILGKLGIPINNLGFNYNFSLFNPGFIFVITGIIIVLLWKSSKTIFFKASFVSLKGAINPFIVIISMSAIVQIMILSGNNYSSLPAAITLISKGFETSLLPFFTPFIGAFGAFMTGSVTISNIMFGHFFNTAALDIGFNTQIILSLGVVGAAIGNMIALSDILAAEAVTDIKNSEIHIIKGVIIPCLTCLIILGLVGIIIFR
jgi:lactate permease